MIPSAFDYFRATSVEEALASLQEGGEDAKIIAGGQSLMPVLRLRLAAPSLLVDLGGVARPRGVRGEGGGLVLGAATPHFEIPRGAVGQGHRGPPVPAAQTGGRNQA